jgi:hypothetical protein
MFLILHIAGLPRLLSQCIHLHSLLLTRPGK